MSTTKTSLAVACLFTVLTVGLASSPAAAQENYKAPFIELGLGATNMIATVGNGGLTTGVSKDGDVSVLSWPSPSYFDHLSYITTNAPDAREQPRYGAPKRAGVFAALRIVESAGDEPQVTFLRDWDKTVTYAQDDVRVIETTFTHENYGLEVAQRDSVAPNRDVLVRRYQVEVTGDQNFESIDVIGYANLAPNQSKLPQVPLLDVMMDHKNDFLAVWNDTEDAIVQFHPNDTGIITEVSEILSSASGTIGRDFGPLGDLLKDEQPDSSEVQNLVGNLDDHYAEGVYAALGASPSPVSYQIGEDETDFCAKLDEIADNIAALQERFPDRDLPAEPGVADVARCENSFDPVDSVRDEQGWSYTAEDAFTDLKDGQLAENPIAGAQANTALRVPVEFDDAGQEGEAALYFAFGGTAEEANDTLNWAQNEGAQAIEQSVVSNDQQFIDELWIPDEIDGGLRKFVKRAFLNLKVGTDRDTGAIVASISRQPSYQLDWPRDGAFFNTALDLAGQHELVSRRMQFYSDAIRDEQKEPVLFLNPKVPGWPGQPGKTEYPPGSWEMNYYADGMPGGNIRLEIDNTALLVWAYVAHIGHLPEEDRAEYIDSQWPTIKRAANFVADWRDPETGLMWPAQEDDHSAFTQGLQGASTSYLALESAARLAKQRGEDELADRWLERAGELHAATMHYMGDEEHGFVDYQEGGGGAAGRGWLAWPTHFLPYDNSRLLDIVKSKVDSQARKVRGEEGNFNYPTKAAISAAIALEDGEDRDKALEVAERMATEIANQNTWTIGEQVVTVDENDDGQAEDFLNTVSPPHLWSSMLVYVTAVAYYHPEEFDKYRDVLPEVNVPEVVPPGVDQGDPAPNADAGSTSPDGGTSDGGSTMADAAAGDLSEDPPDGNDDGCNGCSSPGSGVPIGGAFWAAVLFGFVALRRFDK